MLDTAPENTGALQCCREDAQVYHLGVLFSKVGTVCVEICTSGSTRGQQAAFGHLLSYSTGPFAFFNSLFGGCGGVPSGFT